ncbi:MAG: DUF4179 domain-containing protein [Lachnospiraceae bacterium]|nr:DUF4179 domain-containing protein [Lachnospiraceae bacterium]
MREKDIMEKMQSEVIIPDVVQERAELAFEKIRTKEGKRVVKMRSRKRRWKTMWIAVAAAVFALGTLTVCAAYLRWSKGLEAGLHATDEQKQLLEEGQYAAPLDNENSGNGEGGSNSGDSGNSSGINNRDGRGSVTAGGVTITPQQSIVDRRFAWLSFQVEGYELEEGKEPCFQDVTVEVEGDKEAILSQGSYFYDGIHRDEDGRAVYEDGSPAEGEIFVNADGYMEYIIMVDATQYGENGLIGQNVHVEFTGLGTVYKAEYFPDLEAVWAFDFTLKGSDEVRALSLSEPLGDSGATVIYAEISPVSIYVNYDFPMQEEEIEGIGENGEPITSTTFVEVPPVVGVRLKNGTLLSYITNGGVEGYLDESHEIYTESYALDRILDTDQVDALLFKKNSPSGEGGLTEDDLYIVPIQ